MRNKYRYNQNAVFEILIGEDDEGNVHFMDLYDPSLDDTPEKEKYPAMRGLNPDFFYTMPNDKRMLLVSGYHLDKAQHDCIDRTESLAAKYGSPADQVECCIVNMRIDKDYYGIKYPVRFDVILDGRTIKGFLIQLNRNKDENFISPPSKRGDDGKYYPLYDLSKAVIKQISDAALAQFQDQVP